MKKYPNLSHFGRQSPIAESQSFYSRDIVESEIQDSEVKSIGEELSTISEKKLEFVIDHVNKLITQKVDSTDNIADAADFNRMKGYVAGLKDIKRLFEGALQAKRN